MRELFVDTSAWYPLVVRSAPGHASLGAAIREHILSGSRIVTTSLVIAESHAMIMRRAGIEAGLAFLRRVRQPPTIVVEYTADLEEEAIEQWLGRYRDQRFSMTDAVSFAVMRRREIPEALTLDAHFAIAGYAIVGGQGTRALDA